MVMSCKNGVTIASGIAADIFFQWCDSSDWPWHAYTSATALATWKHVNKPATFVLVLASLPATYVYVYMYLDSTPSEVRHIVKVRVFAVL